MASADMPVERTMFVRKATGLVKGWSVFDAFIYATLSINLITLGFGYAFTGIAVLPESALIAAVVLSALFIVFEVHRLRVARGGDAARRGRLRLADPDPRRRHRIRDGRDRLVVHPVALGPDLRQHPRGRGHPADAHDPRLHRDERLPRGLVAVLGIRRQRHLLHVDPDRDPGERDHRARDAHLRQDPEVLLLRRHGRARADDPDLPDPLPPGLHQRLQHVRPQPVRREGRRLSPDRGRRRGLLDARLRIVPGEGDVPAPARSSSSTTCGRTGARRCTARSAARATSARTSTRWAERSSS